MMKCKLFGAEMCARVLRIMCMMSGRNGLQRLLSQKSLALFSKKNEAKILFFIKKKPKIFGFE
jgi:hypothetical protein